MKSKATTDFPRLADDPEFAEADQNFRRVRQALLDARNAERELIDNKPKREDLEAAADDFVGGADLAVTTFAEATEEHSKKGEKIQLEIRALERALKKAEDARNVAMNEAGKRILKAARPEWDLIVKRALELFEQLAAVDKEADAHIDELRAAGCYHLPPRPHAVASSTIIFSQNSADVWDWLIRTGKKALEE